MDVVTGNVINYCTNDEYVLTIVFYGCVNGERVYDRCTNDEIMWYMC